MKRRNAEIGKMRRPMKRNKITEGIYGSVLLYLKFLVIWGLVFGADFLLEFRFEFLWPFYLLLRSVYDSFKYQGLAFSVFFVCVALTSDMLCFFFIPVHWLFFAASTYVWVQYVWHTDRGFCTPTVLLWLFFIYIEAAVRLKDVKHMPGHLDLCRPFAAHCIGYPVVTLGFGFKSYIGFRMRQRKQRDVAKENDFYMQLMQQALPVEAVSPPSAPPTPTEQPVSALAPAPVQNSVKLHNNNNNSTSSNTNNNNNSSSKTPHSEKNGHIPNGTIANGGLLNTSASSTRGHHHRKSVDKCKEHEESQHRQRHSNGTAVGAGAQEEEHEAPRMRRREKKEMDKEREAAEYLQKVELEAKRLRAELQSCRASEQELRLQVAALTTSEKVSKGELSTMQREIEDLQQRYQNVLSSRSSDKQTISNLERRVAEERRARCSLESQLNQERKSRKQEEARAAQVVAQSTRGECTETCRARRRELEAEIAEFRATKHWAEERCIALERDNATYVEQHRDMEVMYQTLTATQEKNAHLENSLSAETRIKLDLFSALGEAKRQLEIRESSNRTQEREIEELKSKIAQVLAVMPNASFGSPAPTTNMSRVRLAESPPGSTLDPNATAYTPKGSLVASTEA